MINSTFFSHNRTALRNRLDGSVIILAAHGEMQRVKDMAYAFEQESNFWWLTGITAPGWLLVIADDVSYLVKPEADEVHEVFNGTLSDERAKDVSGVDEVISRSAYEKLVKKLAKKHSQVFTLGGDPSEKWYSFTLNPTSDLLREKLEGEFNQVVDCRAELSELRAIKRPSETAALQAAVDLTTDAFTEVKHLIATAHYEYELEAHFNSKFRVTGAGGHAYDPIVASAKNACTLHYNANNDKLPKSGLVLIDVGASVDGYAADITRTYAVGTPTKRQVAVHRAVEEAHQKIINLIKPGVSFASYQESVDEIMKDALEQIGLLKDRSDQVTYRTYFPHAVSHGLGVDVHESLGGYKEFMQGMILTVEPGIYIPEEGIGVRIEDDILVTETGHKNLSEGLPTAL